MNKEDIILIENIWQELYGEDMRLEYPGFFKVLES